MSGVLSGLEHLWPSSTLDRVSFPQEALILLPQALPENRRPLTLPTQRNLAWLSAHGWQHNAQRARPVIPHGITPEIEAPTRLVARMFAVCPQSDPGKSDQSVPCTTGDDSRVAPWC